jgi:hypothetical protein
MVDIINDLRKLGDGASGLAKRMGKKLGEALVKLRAVLKSLPRRFEDLKQKLAPLVAMFSVFTDLVDNNSEALTRLQAAVAIIAGGAALTKLIALGEMVAVAFAAIGVATLGEALILLGGVILFLTTIFFVIDDIITFMKGGDSILGDIIDTIESADTGPLAAIKDLFVVLKSVGLGLYDSVLQPLGVFFATVLPPAIAVAIAAAKQLWTVFNFFIEGTIRGVTALILVFQAVFSVIDDLINGGGKLSTRTMQIFRGLNLQIAKFVNSLLEAVRLFNIFGDEKKVAKARFVGVRGAAQDEFFGGGSEGLKKFGINRSSGGAAGALGSGGGKAANVTATSTVNLTQNISGADPQAVASAATKGAADAAEDVNKKTVAKLNSTARSR